MPLISVIVPVYKVEAVLHHCIDSILAQTFTDFELILIDDGSPDDSGRICDQYADKDERVRVFHNDNHGVSFTRNYGIERARGKYICFVDSDDYVQPDYIELLVQAKADNPNCNNIWCCANFISDYNGTLFSKTTVAEDKYYISSVRKKAVSLNDCLWVSPPWNKLFTRQIIIDNNLKMNEDLSLGEDLIFNLEYIDCTDGEILIVNKELYNYLYGNNNALSTKYYSNLSEIYLKIYETWDYYITKWQADSIERQKNVDSMFNSYARVFVNTFNADNKASFMEKLRYNKRILLSKNYQYIVENCTCNMDLVYRFAYNMKSPFVMYFYYKSKELKEKLYKLVKG